MKRIALIILAVVGVNALLVAQQDPMNTLFVQNPSLLNPAYAGAKGVLSVAAGTRLQWTGVDGAPQTSQLNFSTPLKGDAIAIGLNVANDQIGPVKQNGIFADVAYSLPVGVGSEFRVGLRAGFSTFSANLNSLALDQSGDFGFSQNISGELMPNVGFGVYFSNEKFFAGVSVPTLLKNEIKGVETVTARSFGKEMHTFGMVGANLDLNNNVVIKPAITARFVPGAPVSADIQVMGEFYEKFGLGAMYRISDAFALMANFMLSEQFKLGYAYDLTTSDFAAYNNGSHEVMLSYDFLYKRSRVNSPRYF